jgi:sporulation protein YlmC with PRC-barrel domain
MKRSPANELTADHNAQVTIGGARSVVSGEIRKMEGEYYFINDNETGNEVRLLVNKDANLDCSAAPIATAGATAPSVAKDRQPGEQQVPEASDRQKEQGQKKDQTAVGSGFRIGACSFKPGDRIKAEVDDMGRVTTLKFMRTREEPQTARSLGESAATGVLAIPDQQEKPGQLDMTGPHGYPPKEYAVPPVPLGELKSLSDDLLLHSSVMNVEGQVIGSLANLLMDLQTGQIEYAVVLLNDSERLEVVPWAHMKKGPNQGKQEFILNTTQYQLSPSPGASKDRSLEVEKLLEDTRANLRAESSSPERRPVKIEITMQDRGYDVKGHSLPDSLTAIVLRNQDTVTHGISSPRFKELVIRAEGDATEVQTEDIRSYHVPAGKTATLYFTQASHVDPLTGYQETIQYPFRCDLHPNMKGEFLVIETRGEMGGG